MNGMWTTTVGSFPKPDYLKRARSRYLRGDLSEGELRELEEQATREVIEFQEEVGLDILVDGEMYRGDMATFFAERMEGFRISGFVRSYGNRYYRKPVAVGPVRWPGSLTVEMFQLAQSLTDKPVKGMITGPYTMMDWSFDEHYGSRRAFALEMAHQLHQEALALEKTGARYIQIDEPALSARPDEVDLVVETMEIMTEGLSAKTIMHVCYGNFERIYPRILDIPVDQIDLELANSNFDLLDYFGEEPFTKEIGLGVIDVHNHRVESVEEVEEAIRRALTVLRAEQIYVDPDCGLKTRTWDEARQKLEVMVEATRRVKASLAA